MRIWLDDVRPMPEGFDVHIKNAMEAMKLIALGTVTHISFDHDLGLDMSGYAVACCVEAAAFASRIPRLTWAVHSANPVGRENITACMKKAEQYWEPNHCCRCGVWLIPKGQFQGAGGPNGSPDGIARKFACYPQCEE
jgi:hypothetical protein